MQEYSILGRELKMCREDPYEKEHLFALGLIEMNELAKVRGTCSKWKEGYIQRLERGSILTCESGLVSVAGEVLEAIVRNFNFV